MILTTALRWTSSPLMLRQSLRSVATLSNNLHIYTFPQGSLHILTLLPTFPPTETLAIGTSTVLPPTPASFTENKAFLSILHEVLRLHAAEDPLVQGQAAAFASTSGSALGSGGMFFPQQRKAHSSRSTSSTAGDGAGGASSQGGAGGGGRGGWVHVSDSRAPPDYGRIAWPEDIFGSLEVDGRGEFVEADEEGGGRGRYQESGTYRVVTRDGMLGLSDYLRGKVVERLLEEEGRLKGGS